MKLEIQHLLDKLEVIRLRQELTSSTDRFNIFSILRSEADEVNLHSRFLYELLNPKGSHGMESTFLNLFTKVVELPELDYNNVQVLREHANIDILIQDNQHAIVIENKIYANDQHEQLKRYHEYVINSYRKPTLFYLTLDGKEPSNWSVGNLGKQVHLISYREQIDQWLTSCIKEAATRPALRETILQYQNLIRQLTGNAMSENEKREVLHLMSQHDNAEKAVIIARNWGHVRWHTEWHFWDELLILVKLTYQVPSESEGQFSDYEIHKMVHGKPKKNPYYGIWFPVGKLFGEDFNFKIERGEKPMYYGFHHYSKDENVRSQISGALQHLGAASTDYWPGWKETADGLDLYNFDYSPVTQQLANPEKRQIIVPKLWREIQSFIQKSVQALQQVFGNDFEPIKLKQIELSN